MAVGKSIECDTSQSLGTKASSPLASYIHIGVEASFVCLTLTENNLSV